MRDSIVVRGAREHNLKNIDIDIPRERLVVVTGLSGSGKSSLAFDTIYAEGQRRFMESLSAYARQFLGMMERPAVDFIDGLSPVISIDQKTTNRNPRSTVGTVTEVTDFLRLLYARTAIPYSYKSGEKMAKQTTDQLVESILALPEGTKAYCFAPVVRSRKGHYKELFEQMARQGFLRARVDGEMMDLDQDIQLDRYKTHTIDIVVDRFVISPKSAQRVTDSVRMALEMADGYLILGLQGDGAGPDKLEDRVYSKHLFDPVTGLSYEDPAPNLFSFNSPKGACKGCNGLGYRYDIDRELVIPNPDQSIRQGAIRFLGKPRDMFQFSLLEAVLAAYEVDFDTPLKEFSDDLMDVLFEGSGREKFDVIVEGGSAGAGTGQRNRGVTYRHAYPGLKRTIREQYEGSSSSNVRAKAEAFMSKMTCSECEGGRLNKEALSYRLGDYNIAELSSMDIVQFRETLGGMELSERQRQIGHLVLKEILDRADFLLNVGLGYLSLDREAQTLSGGEAQRIRLATQIGTQLVGVLYVLDEPSIGLHQRDNVKLIQSLEQLRDLGNSVLVVEHDRETIERADFVVDLGPGAGTHGGHLISAGVPEEMPDASLTAQYMKDIRQIDVAETPRKGNGKTLTLRGATGHNLKDVTLTLPLGTFICLTGVSGSGKSSLINHTLTPLLSQHFYKSLATPLPYQSMEGMDHIDKIISIDQSPIGRTPRSNPGTYTKVFDHIRMLFAELPESKIRGYGQGRFSFNVKGGRCETCSGDGMRKIEMNFLPDVYVKCERCGGKRYNRDTLEIFYQGKTIHDVLEMPVEEAVEFFKNIPSIHRKLETLMSVGLGYITLGQSSTTISGGEAQRMKLSRELSKTGTGNTLYVMDEPTTGLHFHDVKQLVDVVQRLVDRGNTVVVIEHNMDLIKAADWVIDMGPEGGRGGGEILVEGTPKQLASLKGKEMERSYTAQFLKEELDRIQKAPKPIVETLS